MINKDLYSYIFKRKSTRKYEMKPLSEDFIFEIKEYVNAIEPLYPDIKVAYHITDTVKGVFSAKAPHYIVVSSEKKPGYLENVGFMFQQVDLFLASKGFGSCWLGMSKPVEKATDELDFIITLAFGLSMESPYRMESQFKRKQLSEISLGSDDRLKAAQFAPSATNSQHWFFVAEQGKIHCYLKKLGAVQAVMYENMNKVDIGIAIAHLAIATKYFHGEFAFSVEENAAKIERFYYIGTVA